MNNTPEPSLSPPEDRFMYDARQTELYDGDEAWEGPDGHIYHISNIHDIRMEQTDEEWAEENGYTRIDIKL